MTKIAIVTSGHLVTCPRVVREANILTNAGFEVAVITTSRNPAFDVLDQRVYDAAPWRWSAVDLKAYHQRSLVKLRTLAHRGFQRVGVSGRATSGSAHSGVWKPLAHRARAHRADLYIGHNLPGLLAAVVASHRHKTPVMFDAEDWHPGELSTEPRHRREIDARWQLLSRCLPQVAAVSASSPRIAGRYRTAFGTHCEVVLNTGFRDTQHQDWVIRRRCQRLNNGSRRVFWFSQTIGLGRGLEEVIPLLCRAHPNVSLHVQGQVSTQVKHQLQSIWQCAGGLGEIEFRAFSGPQALRHAMHQFDIGLSVELNHNANQRACLSNKLFTYIESAMPQIISKTPAQYDLRHSLKQAALFVDLSSKRQSQEGIMNWLNDATELTRAVQALPALFRLHFSDDEQAQRLLGCVYKALDQQAQRHRPTEAQLWAA